MVKWPYLIIWSSIVIIIASHRVTESIEEDPPPNITTLYPVVANTTVENKNETKDLNDTKKDTSDAAAWKVETTFSESKLPDLENTTDTKLDKTNDFKPSPQLETFFDDSSEALPTRATTANFVPIRKPAAGFLSTLNNPFKSSLHSVPRETYRQNEFPYKIENSIFTKAKNGWQPTLDSKPTVEVPVKVPAGGMYMSPDAFKDKPGVGSDDDDFGLEFTGNVKENSGDMKKRVNPWKNLLRLMTAFIPVGLIISALTPSVITIENTDNLDNRYPQPFFRRADSSQLTPISEPCRRRLLCELHSERNYMHGVVPQRKGKPCYKIRCEEPDVLSRTLHWLLTYHRSGVEDERGRDRNYN